MIKPIRHRETCDLPAICRTAGLAVFELGRGRRGHAEQQTDDRETAGKTTGNSHMRRSLAGYSRYLSILIRVLQTANLTPILLLAGSRGNSPIFVASCHKNRDSPLDDGRMRAVGWRASLDCVVLSPPPQARFDPFGVSLHRRRHWAHRTPRLGYRRLPADALCCLEKENYACLDHDLTGNRSSKW